MKIIIISGPTASGKSTLALELAKQKDIAIINADALQIYKGLPILSAQPTPNETEQAPHFLYSYFEPHQSCSVGLWLDLVKQKAEEIFLQNKIPVIVGGTGMYISKLLDGIVEIPEISTDIKIKARQLFETLGRDNFIKELLRLNEDEQKIINLDKQRLIRAYEVLIQTSKSIFLWQQQPHKFIFDPKIYTHINLEPKREILYKNCDLRLAKMFDNGAVDEVQNLINQRFEDNWQITKTLGFAEIKDYLSGNISKDTALENAAQKTRNYAKRQLTWFRNQFIDKRVFEDVKTAQEFLRKL